MDRLKYHLSLVSFLVALSFVLCPIYSCAALTSKQSAAKHKVAHNMHHAVAINHHSYGKPVAVASSVHTSKHHNIAKQISAASPVQASKHHHAAHLSAAIPVHAGNRYNHIHTVTQYIGSEKHVISMTSHHGRYQRPSHRHKHGNLAIAAHAQPRHAYPLNIFLISPPSFNRTPLSAQLSSEISQSFNQGYADNYAARSLVRAGVVTYHPLHGGIFWRRQKVQYIIMHSTETGVPQSAPRVIESWGSGGRRHAGAQYVIDRDGTIYQAVDPDLATVHINIFKTLPGINNDNSIGIEMCHTGHQEYPEAQRQSAIKLVTYLQDRYKIADANIMTHRYVQQGDHTDPVAFDWDKFLADKNSFHNRAIALKANKLNAEASTAFGGNINLPPAYLQPHPALTDTAPEQSTENEARSNGMSVNGSTSTEAQRTVKTAPMNAEERRTGESMPEPDITGQDIQEQAGIGSQNTAGGTAADQSRSSMQNIINKTLLRGPIEMDPSAAQELANPDNSKH